MVGSNMEKENIIENLRKALLKYGYSAVVVERILSWYS